VDARRDRPVLTPIGGSAGPPLRIVALVAALITLAVLKPWNGIGAGTATDPSGLAAPSATIAPAAPAPTPAQTPGPDALECLGPIGWRIATLQRSSTFESKSWTVVAPTAATGPADPAIRPMHIVAADVVAIGFCGDGQRQGTPPAVIVGAWRQSVASGAWQPIAVVGSWLGALDGDEAATMEAPAAGPPRSAESPVASPTHGGPGAGIRSSPAWAPGRYAFEVTVGGVRARTSWFRVDLNWPADPAPADATSANSTPTIGAPPAGQQPAQRAGRQSAQPAGVIREG